MPGKEFFARMGPEFALHTGSAQESAGRQAAVERLLCKAEYECYQVRRELAAVMAGISVPVPEAGAVAMALAEADATGLSAAAQAPAKAA